MMNKDFFTASQKKKLIQLSREMSDKFPHLSLIDCYNLLSKNYEAKIRYENKGNCERIEKEIESRKNE